MNNYPQMFNPNFVNMGLQYQDELKSITNQINILSQEIKRIERRLFNLEKNLLPTPYNKLNPTPMNSNSFESMNSNYSKDNYII